MINLSIVDIEYFFMDEAIYFQGSLCNTIYKSFVASLNVTE